MTFNLVHRFDLALPPARDEVLTVHDIAPLRFDDEGDFPKTAATSIKRAAAVVCPSHFSAREICSTFGRTDVDVIPNGLDPIFLDAEPLGPAERRKLELPDRWVMHTGGATRRKNLAVLADAWRLVHERHQDLVLVMCGPEDPKRTQMFADVPGTRVMGKVPRNLVPRLMASAAVVVVPSTYEGYGLPALEAMASYTPLVVSDAASLPEIVGTEAVLVEPTVRGLADGISLALAGLPNRVLHQARERARRCTWAAAAAAYIEVYDRLTVGRV